MINLFYYPFYKMDNWDYLFMLITLNDDEFEDYLSDAETI